MRRKFVLFTLLTLIVNLSGAENLSFAQRENAKAIYKVPANLELKNNVSNGEPRSNPASLIAEEFYPIGWSRDGKFAYYTEPPDEACGCYFGDLYVQDMRTDKIVWSNRYEGNSELPDENISTHWRKNQKLFDRQLARFGIVQSKDFTVRESPLEAAGDSVKIDFFSDVKMLEDTLTSEGSVFVKLLSKQKGAKTVYQKTYTSKNDYAVMMIETGGVLISPFEPRAAIILVETHRGWEGPPNITRLKVVGANLTGGYR